MALLFSLRSPFNRIVGQLRSSDDNTPMRRRRDLERSEAHAAGLLARCTEHCPIGLVFSGSLPARQAGGLAGIMGAPQFDLPQAALAYYSTVSGAEVQVGNAPCTVSVFLLPWLVPSMVILWIFCVIIGIVALRKLSRQLKPPNLLG